MNLETIFTQFTTDIQVFRWQEWVSTLCQILSVWYAQRNNILVYPTGIIGVLLAAWVYFFIASPPLYADGVLNVYYFGMSVLGWYLWTKKKTDQEYEYPITWCTTKELSLGILGFSAGWALIYLLLTQVTDSNTPVLDSLVSASAFTAMWWMANRKIENWLAWIFSNIVAIPLNFYKGFMLFTLMYVVFLFMAFSGFIRWKKQQKTG